jgi:hypothetical protein
MSFAPGVLNRLDQLDRLLYIATRMNSVGGKTVVVPIMEQTLPAGGDTTLYMDHPLLPPADTFVLQEADVQAHDLSIGLAYECMAQINSGCFHLIGEPGLFAVGIAGSSGSVTLTVNLLSSETATNFTGAGHALFFLGPQDRFLVSFDEPDTSWSVASGAYLVISRLTSVPIEP